MGETIVSHRPPNGRLLLLSCRVSSSNKDVIRTKLIRRFYAPSPIYAITKLDETSVLSGSWLIADV